MRQSVQDAYPRVDALPIARQFGRLIQAAPTVLSLGYRCHDHVRPERLPERMNGRRRVARAEHGLAPFRDQRLLGLAEDGTAGVKPDGRGRGPRCELDLETRWE